jgi:hypothetical protein
VRSLWRPARAPFLVPKWLPISFRSWFILFRDQKGTPTMSEWYSESPFSPITQNAPKESPTRGRNFGFVDTLLIRTEVWYLKGELNPLSEDPYRVVDQLDQFLGFQIYTWVEHHLYWGF